MKLSPSPRPPPPRPHPPTALRPPPPPPPPPPPLLSKVPARLQARLLRLLQMHAELSRRMEQRGPDKPVLRLARAPVAVAVADDAERPPPRRARACCTRTDLPGAHGRRRLGLDRQHGRARAARRRRPPRPADESARVVVVARYARLFSRGAAAAAVVRRRRDDAEASRLLAPGTRSRTRASSASRRSASTRARRGTIRAVPHARCRDYSERRGAVRALRPASTTRRSPRTRRAALPLPRRRPQLGRRRVLARDGPPARARARAARALRARAVADELRPTPPLNPKPNPRSG